MSSLQDRPLNEFYAWQKRQWQTFQSLLDTGMLPHGVLMTGPSDVGKYHFAAALATRVLCQSPVDGQGCSSCKACLLMAAGSHPDFLLLEPETKGKAISVDAVRGLVGFSTGTAMLGGWRVMLINSVEAMTHSAANALLKCLEEPGKATLLILIHHQQSEVLATIRSRCQQFLFPIPDPDQAIQWLRGEIETNDYASLLEAAGGRPLRAVRFGDDNSFEKIKQFQTMLEELSRGLLSPVEAAEQWKSVAPNDLVEWMLAFQTKSVLREVTHNSLPDRRHFVFMDQLLYARRLLASKANPNPQLLIEDLLSGWWQRESTSRR